MAKSMAQALHKIPMRNDKWGDGTVFGQEYRKYEKSWIQAQW